MRNAAEKKAYRDGEIQTLRWILKLLEELEPVIAEDAIEARLTKLEKAASS